MKALVYSDFDSADSFLKQIRRSNDDWWSKDENESAWVFRGIGDADNWKLIPSAWRLKEENKLQPLLDKIREKRLVICDEEPNSMDSIFRQRLEWESAELEALYQFAVLANSAGFHVPKDSYSRGQSPLALQKAIGWDKNGKLAHIESLYPEIEFVALAQHHGLPTRLLDWSYNPLVAAFFAASSSSSSSPSSAEKICVWALDTRKLLDHLGNPRQFGNFKVLLHTPNRSNNLYLHSQGGLLTELEGASSYFTKRARWPALENVFEDQRDSSGPILIGHILSMEHVPRLRLLLDREGFNNALLMPSLDNVAKTIISRWHSKP